MSNHKYLTVIDNIEDFTKEPISFFEYLVLEDIKNIHREKTFTQLIANTNTIDSFWKDKLVDIDDC